MPSSVSIADLRYSYSQSGRLVEFDGVLVRQKLVVTISEASPEGKQALEEFQQKRNRNELTPVIKMVFHIDKAGVYCQEISAQGGEGYRNVTLDTFAQLPNPRKIAEDALRLWNRGGTKEWRLISTDGKAEPVGLPNRREIVARERLLKKTKEQELIEVARIDLLNPESPNKAVEKHFGYKDGTARNRRHRARQLGLLPPESASEAERQVALERLNQDPEQIVGDVRELLGKLKKGRK